MAAQSKRPWAVMASYLNSRDRLRKWRVWGTYATQQGAEEGRDRMIVRWKRLDGFTARVVAPGESRKMDG